MKYTIYTFAAADFVGVAVACAAALLLWFAVGWAVLRLFSLGHDVSESFEESEEDVRWSAVEDAPDLSETGVACEIAQMAPGAQLVEVDTAGMLTPPQQVWVHEYVWTGSAVKFVRRVPLSEFDFLIPGSAMHAASHPEALAARETFLCTTAGLPNRFDPLPDPEIAPAQGGVTTRRIAP